MRNDHPLQGSRLVLGLLLMVLGSWACTPPEELDDEDLEVGLSLDELVEVQTEAPSLAQRAALHPWPKASPPPSPARLAMLPEAIRQKPLLAELTLRHELETPRTYHGGVLGLKGAAKVFVASTEQIQDYSRLYWVMVHVLSDKYGCFMVEKLYHGDKTRVRCRDGRQVLFWQSRGPGWIQFVTRQFDAHGYEIVVRKRQIVRISQNRVI